MLIIYCQLSRAIFKRKMALRIRHGSTFKPTIEDFRNSPKFFVSLFPHNLIDRFFVEVECCSCLVIEEEGVGVGKGRVRLMRELERIFLREEVADVLERVRMRHDHNVLSLVLCDDLPQERLYACANPFPCFHPREVIDTFGAIALELEFTAGFDVREIREIDVLSFVL